MQPKCKVIYTQCERGRSIGARALQLAMGAPLLIEVDNEELKRISYSPIELAKKEFDGGILPITIKRPLPHKSPDPSLKD